MRSIVRCLLLAVVLACTGCSSLISVNYAGPDRGHVVMSVHEASSLECDMCAFFFRRVGGPDSGGPTIGRFNYSVGSPYLTTGANYENRIENGATIVAALPPGDYELYNYNFVQEVRSVTGMRVERTHFPAIPFSIRFSVRSGAVAYLGSYRVEMSSGGSGFTASDRRDKDLAAAQAHNPALANKPVYSQVPALR